MAQGFRQDLIDEARAEFEENGTVSTSTALRMAEQGYDAPAIIHQLSEEKSGRQET